MKTSVWVQEDLKSFICKPQQASIFLNNSVAAVTAAAALFISYPLLSLFSSSALGQPLRITSVTSAVVEHELCIKLVDRLCSNGGAGFRECVRGEGEVRSSRCVECSGWKGAHGGLRCRHADDRIPIWRGEGGINSAGGELISVCWLNNIRELTYGYFSCSLFFFFSSSFFSFSSTALILHLAKERMTSYA